MLTPLHAQEDEPLPDIAWTVDGELWLASAEMEPLRVDVLGACCAVFSQGRTRLAFVSDDQLMVIDLANPTEPRVMASDALVDEAVPVSIRWGDESTIFFNTALQSERDDVQLLAFELPLWRADVESGDVTPFPVSGAAFPNLRGDLVAVLDPGIYDETPMTMALLHPDGEILSSHQHPAVSSASHMGWLAEIHWPGSGDGLRYALPDPDLVYTPFDAPPPPTQLFEAFSEGDEPDLLGEIITPFPADVAWSPDGSQIAYLSPLNGANQQDVLVMTISNGESIVALENFSIGVSLVDWRDQLAIYDPGRGLILWTPENTIEIPDVLGVTAHSSGGWVLVKADNTISLYADGEKRVIARDVDAFSVTLASG